MSSPNNNGPNNASAQGVSRVRFEHLWLGAILVLGLALRLARLGTHPFWHDEVFNVLKTDYLGMVIFQGEYVSNHPPLFAVLLWLWRLVGLLGSEPSARLVTVFLGLGGIVVTYFAGKRLCDARTGLIAAFLLAISPFHVLHSQDLKVYVLLPVTGTLALLALHKALARNTRRDWFLYALAAAVACYSENHAGPLLVAANLWAMTQLPGRLNRLAGWLMANVAAVAVFSPHLIIAFAKVNDIMVQAQGWWLPAPTPWSVVFYLKTLAFGYSDREPLFKIALAVFVLLACVGFVWTWRRQRATALLLGMWFVLPIGIVYVISHCFNSIFLIRALMPYAIPFYILVAVAVAQARGNIVRGALLLGLAALAAVPLADYYRDIYPLYEFPHRPGVHPPVAYGSAAGYVSERWREGDVVVHSCGVSWLPFWYYGFRDRPQFSVTPSTGFVKYMAQSNPASHTHEDMEDCHTVLLQPVVRGKPRVWFVCSEWERVYRKHNPMAVWLWLDAHFEEVDHASFEGIEVFLYADPNREPAFRTASRDRDNGVAATLQRAAGSHEKVRPDAGVVPSPPEARRGAIELRFSEADDGELLTLASSPQKRAVGFEIENQGNEAAECTVMVFASDALLDVAALYEETPESDAWQVVSFGDSGLAVAECDVPIAVWRGTTLAPASLAGDLELPPGEYDSYCYAQGLVPDDTVYTGAFFFVQDQKVRTFRADIQTAPDWQWIATGILQVSQSPVAVKLSAATDVPVGVGYVAFVRSRQAGRVLPHATVPVSLAPHETQCLCAEVDADAARTDIWVFNAAEPKRVYRIFRVHVP